MAKVAKAGTSVHDFGSAFELLGKSFNLFKANWVIFVAVQILLPIAAVLALILALFGFAAGEISFSDTETPDFSAVSTGGMVATIIVGALAFLYLSVLSVMLTFQVALHKTATFEQLVALANKYFFRIIGLGLLAGIAIFLGLLLLIVPGIFLIQRFMMSGYAMLDKDLSIGAAITESRRLGKTYSGPVWAVLGVSIVVSIFTGLLGYIPVLGAIVGAVLSMGWSMIIPLRYAQLQGKKV